MYHIHHYQITYKTENKRLRSYGVWIYNYICNVINDYTTKAVYSNLAHCHTILSDRICKKITDLPQVTDNCVYSTPHHEWESD